MIWLIFKLTLRQFAIRRSTLALAGLCAIPVVVAVVFRLSDHVVSPERFTARALFVGLIAGVTLPDGPDPGTSAIGDEIEDGTVIICSRNLSSAGRYYCRKSRPLGSSPRHW
jgi:hypothetical protein